MQEIINQIYWFSVKNSYLIGSKFKRRKDYTIDLENPWITFGQVIMSWRSSEYFLSEKEVPYLPLLPKGKEYQIHLDLTAYPQGSLIYRLNFFDLQGSRIKKIDFLSFDKIFTIPSTTVTYSFEIINAGCQRIHFRRLQIAPSYIKQAAFADFYFDQIQDQTNSDEINLLLVADSKRARKIQTDLFKKYSFLTVLYVSWQKRGQLSKVLQNYLAKRQNQAIRIFSSHRKFDKLLIDWQQKITYPVKIITSSQLALNQITEGQVWLRKDCYDPDWWLIKKKLHASWRK